MSSSLILCIEDNPTKQTALQKELARLKENSTLLFISSTQDPQQSLSNLASQNQELAFIVCGQPTNIANTLSLLQSIKQSAMDKHCHTLLLDCDLNAQFMMQVVNLSQSIFCLNTARQEGDLVKVIEKKQADLQHAAKESYAINFPALTNFYQTFHLNNNDEAISEQLASELIDYFEKHNDKSAFLNYSPNHVLTIEGTNNAYLWFVIQGEIDLFKKDASGNTYQLNSLGKGCLIGSMSFISGSTSFSTTITRTKAQVIKIDRNVFNQILTANNALLPLFTEYLLRHFNTRLRNTISTEVTLQQTLQSLEVAHNELIQKEKMAMLGQLVAGVAHELNNPVSAILSNTENLKSIILHLVNEPMTEKTRHKAKQILANALLSNPISTAEIREKSKNIADRINNQNLARKIVNMRLDREIDTWITFLKNDFQATLLKWEKFYQAGSLLRSNQVCAKRIAEMVKSLKGYARNDTTKFELVDLHEGIEDSLTMFENRMKQVELIKDYANLPFIHCQPIAIQQVWTNLISNALDAIADKGIIHITTQEYDYLSQTAVKMTIKDNGIGIPEEKQQSIFELNFTTKREGHFGLGIGLSICKQIVDEHKGIIEVESIANKYTAISVILPVQPSIIKLEH